jgi:hypothetical protein
MTANVNISGVSSAASIRACTYSQLEVAVAWGPGAAAGHIGIPFLIANTGKSACSLEGYPTLHIYPVPRNRGPVKVIESGGMVYSPVKPKLIVIKPGADASFGLNYVDALNQGDSNGPACTAQTVDVTLPVRYDNFPQNYQTTVNFNFCYSGFAVSVTSIQSGPVPREG